MIVRHCFRLNLKKEQHQRVQKVLIALDKEIYKSESQFIIHALDAYIQSFEEEGEKRETSQKKTTNYVTREEVAEIKKEISSQIKDELLQLLGGSLSRTSLLEEQEKEKKEQKQELELTEENDPVVAELASRWG